MAAIVYSGPTVKFFGGPSVYMISSYISLIENLTMTLRKLLVCHCKPADPSQLDQKISLKLIFITWDRFRMNTFQKKEKRSLKLHWNADI